MYFNFSKKTVISIVGGVAIAVAMAVLIVLLILKGAKDTVVDVGNYSSSSKEESSVSSIVEAPILQEDKKLAITTPSSLNTTVTSSKMLICGTSDIKEPLKMNGKDVQRSDDGSFAIEVELSVGKNTFNFEHKGQKTVCNITYRYVVINSCTPSNQEKYPSGSTFTVSANARVGSTVTATFNGATITLKPENNTENKEFIDYTGSFTLTDKNDTDLNMGKVAFTGSYNDTTEKLYSGNIICLKNTYLAGRSYVAEVVAFTAETFNGATTDDYSDPRYNYLPKGTVDYCDSGLIYDSNSKNTYIKLRCGRRIYVDRPTDDKKSRTVVASRYKGTLPDHNEISVASLKQSGHHTVLTLDTMWKAPFLLDLAPQSYKNPSKQDFTITSTTFQYVEIEFCYATVFNGSIEIPKSNPVFERAEIIPANGKHILRLYLKRQGEFYGWDSYYNDKGQLCFEFLNPINTEQADNEYGINLSGAKILIDAGHGGFDPGAVRGNTHEEERNLALAKKIKGELEKIGATVILTRTADYTVTSDERRQILKRERPDYCIAIHHNAATVKSAHGFEAFHFNAFTKNAAKMVFDRTMQTGLYSNSKFKSHYFFLSRITTCPVVLTESGYFSNDYDYNNIISEAANIKKAKAIVKGIADYFVSIRFTPVVEPEPLPEPSPEPTPEPEPESKPESSTENETSSLPPEPPKEDDDVTSSE